MQRQWGFIWESKLMIAQKLGKEEEAILDWAIGETKDGNGLDNLCFDKYGNELDNWKIGETKVSSNWGK